MPCRRCTLDTVTSNKMLVPPGDTIAWGKQWIPDTISTLVCIFPVRIRKVWLRFLWLIPVFSYRNSQIHQFEWRILKSSFCCNTSCYIPGRGSLHIITSFKIFDKWLHFYRINFPTFITSSGVNRSWVVLVRTTSPFYRPKHTLGTPISHLWPLDHVKM